MANILEYALMAGGAYQTTRAPINLFPVSQNWISFNDQSRDSGFEAVSFTKGSEIVIAYAGTYPKSIGDQLANTGLATGFGSIQLFQAAEYYLQVKTANPGSTITLTGHSLGGGLASLVGVFFGVQAQTFDQAPFAQTALYGGAELLDYLAGKNLYTADTLLPLSSYIAQRQNSGSLIPNSSLVSNINVQGEFLSGAPWTVFDRIGTPPQTIGTTSPGVSAFDMHSQALLTAFLQSIQTAATGKGLAEVTFKLNDLLKMVFDDKLFAFTTDKSNTKDENLLERLVKHQTGIGSAIPADAMLTRFTKDMIKLAKDNGLTLTDGNSGFFSGATNNISKALTAYAMQKYYEETTASVGYKKELFEQITDGIQFDMANVSKKFDAAFKANEKLDLKDAKGFDLYFKKYLESSNFTGTDRQLIRSIPPYMRDWYVQAGSNGLAYTDIQNRSAFMLGGSDGDALVGGHHYQFSSCLRTYPLIYSPIRYPKTALKASCDADASCRRTKSGIQFTINSIAACARKQGAGGQFGSQNRLKNIKNFS
jgi:Lipase (class 3)